MEGDEEIYNEKAGHSQEAFDHSAETSRHENPTQVKIPRLARAVDRSKVRTALISSTGKSISPPESAGNSGESFGSRNRYCAFPVFLDDVLLGQSVKRSAGRGISFAEAVS
jgi:hypothetical protein